MAEGLLADALPSDAGYVIESKMPAVVGRTHLLDRESNQDIKDPMGGTYEDFNSTFDVVNDCLDHWIPVL
jgi:protein-tyrosine-phosphatase